MVINKKESKIKNSVFYRLNFFWLKFVVIVFFSLLFDLALSFDLALASSDTISSDTISESSIILAKHFPYSQPGFQI